MTLLFCQRKEELVILPALFSMECVCVLLRGRGEKKDEDLE